MAKVINHQLLFTTNLKYFKALQIIGGRTIFDRYNAAQSIITKNIDPKYRDFLAYPVVDNDTIEFHGIRSSEQPCLFADLSPEDQARYQQIKEETVAHYRAKAQELEEGGKTAEAAFLDSATKVVDDRFLYCYDGKVVLGAWGMQMKDNIREDIAEIRKSMFKRNKPEPTPVPEPEPVPAPEPEPIPEPVPPTPPTPQPEPEPQVEIKEKRKRRKWNINWKDILKWLLLLLLLLLLLFALSKLIPGCNPSCSGLVPPFLGGDDRDNPGGIYDPRNPYDAPATPPGYNDILPPNQGALPPSDGAQILPGNPSIVANRLNILMENEDKSILDFARAFKNAYPEDKYTIVYYDDVVKRMQVDIPAEEREALKAEIPGKFAPEYELYVFDESLFEGQLTPSDPGFSNADYSWYFPVIKAYGGWEYSTGSKNITVAIVDNGFSLSHPELQSKVVKPYNVWTHSNTIFAQEVDHGTHVAGTALALADNGQGLCGIAPKCKFMPVQVADPRGMMTITSVLDGILYSVYQGADVVNVSLGLSFAGADQLPLPAQQDLVDNHFKEEERLWREVMRIAAKRNCTIVVAAGNENILAGIDALHRPELFVTVAATGRDNEMLNRTEFSNFGDDTTISAPGVDIVSTVGNGEYTLMSGTSMAAPIVTGAVALMKSLDPSITTKRIIQILRATGLPTSGDIGRLIQLDKALEMVKNGTPEEEPQPVPSTGDVQILLGWTNYNDLDLICTDPSGATIWYKNKTVPSGGQLEIDMNVEYPDSEQPIENIFWPAGKAPAGTYNVYVRYYRKHISKAETPFAVMVKHGEQTDTYEGTMTEVGETVHICSFTIGDPSSQPANPGSDRGSVQNPPSSQQPSQPSQPSAGNGSDRNNGGNAGNDQRRSQLEQERDRLQRELDRVENELRRLNNTR